MAPESQLSPLSNPLITPSQLSTSASRLDGLPLSLESHIRYAGALLIQAAGILLHVPQETTARAIVTFTRFYSGPEGGSFLLHSAKDISAASLYLHAKLSPTPLPPRSILTVYTYLLSPLSPLHPSPRPPSPPSALQSPPHLLPSPAYPPLLRTLLHSERLLLRTLSFTTQTTLPHPLALTYLQTLSQLGPPASHPYSAALATRALAHLNAALLSPQQLYLTTQPAALAVAAVYLAAREVGVRLPGGEWWEVFDVGREELGFLVVGMGSLEGWVRGVRRVWGGRGRRVPVTVGEVEGEMRGWGEEVDEEGRARGRGGG